MKIVIIKLVFIACAFLFESNQIAFSQSCNRSRDTAVKTNVLRGSDQHAPFDGGLGLLIAAGMIYGLKKRHDKRKRIKKSACKGEIS